MKFGLLHFRVFETDGVSLEMDKWCYALKKLGHEVVYISGSENEREDHLLMKSLYYKADYNKIIHNNAFCELKDFSSERELLAYINNIASVIEEKLTTLVKENNIDVLVPNNVSSLGFNLPVGIAIANLNKNNVCKFIYHHHDFYFERERYSNPIFKSIQNILDSCFPYKGDAIHCTINHLAKDELFKRKGITANVIPNVFDFTQNLSVKDEYNSDLRERFDIAKEDIVFLQATRIVKRKGIELGYYIIEAFANSIKEHIGEKLYDGRMITEKTKVHFVLAGLNEYEHNFDKLENLINRSDIVIHYINEWVDHKREYMKETKVYSLWDVYTMCDFITYPSVLEGWGNQLLEGLFAKKMMLVYEYPVFKTDIKGFGFNLITFDDELVYDEENILLNLDNETIELKSKNIFDVLLNDVLYKESVEKNFEIAKKHLSYKALVDLLKPFTLNL